MANEITDFGQLIDWLSGEPLSIHLGKIFSQKNDITYYAITGNVLKCGDVVSQIKACPKRNLFLRITDTLGLTKNEISGDIESIDGKNWYKEYFSQNLSIYSTDLVEQTFLIQHVGPDGLSKYMSGNRPIVTIIFGKMGAVFSPVMLYFFQSKRFVQISESLYEALWEAGQLSLYEARNKVMGDMGIIQQHEKIFSAWSHEHDLIVNAT